MNIVYWIDKILYIAKYKIGTLYSYLLLKEVGEQCKIHLNITILKPQKIIINNNCEVRQHCTLDGRTEEEIGILIGSNSKLKEMVSLYSYGGTIILGKSVLIAKSAVLYGHGGISIGDYSMIGPNTVIISSNYALYCEDEKIPFQNIGFTREKITIGNNVWIGANCTILGGSQIEDNTVIAAGSVVRGHLKGNLIYCGVPAKAALSIIGYKTKTPVFKKDWDLFD